MSKSVPQLPLQLEDAMRPEGSEVRLPWLHTQHMPRLFGVFK